MVTMSFKVYEVLAIIEAFGSTSKATEAIRQEIIRKCLFILEAHGYSINYKGGKVYATK